MSESDLHSLVEGVARSGCPRLRVPCFGAHIVGHWLFEVIWEQSCVSSVERKIDLFLRVRAAQGRSKPGVC